MGLARLGGRALGAVALAAPLAFGAPSPLAAQVSAPRATPSYATPRQQAPAPATPPAAPSAAPAAQGMKTVDTGVGITVAVPESWAVARPAGNNRFAIGDAKADFALVVTDFGPAQDDGAKADEIYRASFARLGLDLASSADVAVSGMTVKRYSFASRDPHDAVRVEALMVPVGGEMYCVSVASPLAAYGARAAAVGKILDSVAVKGTAR